MLPLWTPHRHSSFAAFMLLLGLVWVTPSYAALTRPNVEIDPVLPNIPFPVDAPTLSGSQFTSIVELRWSINCSVTAVNIQESVDNQSWTTVYTGLGQADSGAAAYATFAVGGDVCSGGWSSKRLLQLPNKTLPGYYYRINACIGSSCSAYNLPISVGTPSAPSAPRLQPLSRLLQPILQAPLVFLGLAPVALRVMSYSNALMVAHGLLNIQALLRAMHCRDSLLALINIKCVLALQRAVLGCYQVIRKWLYLLPAVIGVTYPQ
jgi:hypothetical protein